MIRLQLPGQTAMCGGSTDCLQTFTGGARRSQTDYKRYYTAHALFTITRNMTYGPQHLRGNASKSCDHYLF